MATPRDSGASEGSDTSNPRPILVTGSHRSGTTWAGRMIAASPAVGYVHEPFHVDRDPGICSVGFENWFTYVEAGNEGEYLDALARTLDFRYDVGPSLAALRSAADVGRAWSTWRSFRHSRRAQARPLMKDPLALLSAEWLAARFDMDVIVMIRHPAAFAASLKQYDWHFPFRHFLNQPLLMPKLKPFEEEIKRFAAEEQPIVDQAALLWRILYSVVGRYREEHEEWQFVRHEDLSRNPIDGFKAIFAKLGLDFDGRIERFVRENSTLPDSDAKPDQTHAIRRKSTETIGKWKESLAPDEIERIREATRDVAGEFYSDGDW